jgi:hypothetical protein
LGQRTWQEADIKGGVQTGGSLLGVFVICRNDERGNGFIPYIRTNWARGFRPLRTYRDRSDRVFRSLDKLVALIREDFGYLGEISLFVAGDAELRRYRTLLPTDRDALATLSEKHAVLEGDAKDWPPADDEALPKP